MSMPHILPKFVMKSRGPLLAADGIVVDGKNPKRILLTKRAIFPFKGYWVLPGGHVKYGETVEGAVYREVREETGMRTKPVALLGVYSHPERDPRYHIVAVSFILKKISGTPKKTREASECRYFHIDRLPGAMGFDHRKMIGDYRKFLKQKV